MRKSRESSGEGDVAPPSRSSRRDAVLSCIGASHDADAFVGTENLPARPASRTVVDHVIPGRRPRQRVRIKDVIHSYALVRSVRVRRAPTSRRTASPTAHAASCRSTKSRMVSTSMHSCPWPVSIHASYRFATTICRRSTGGSPDAREAVAAVAGGLDCAAWWCGRADAATHRGESSADRKRARRECALDENDFVHDTSCFDDRTISPLLCRL